MLESNTRDLITIGAEISKKCKVNAQSEEFKQTGKNFVHYGMGGKSFMDIAAGEFERILKTEYSARFDEIRKNMMVASYYKYGPVRKDYLEFGCMDAIANLKKRLERYEETGNTEFLADVANFAMIEFMYPQKPGAYYTPTDSGSCETIGFGVNEVNREAENL